MREVGYGKGYKYAHEYEGHFVKQQNMPDSLRDRRYYTPSDEGYEKEVGTRLEEWWKERKGD
jgi:putative ATPase